MSTAAPPPAVAVGIDVGTSGARVAAIAADGSLVATAAQRYGDASDRADPATWWHAVSACLDQLAAVVAGD